MTYEPKINSINKRKRRLRWVDGRGVEERAKELKGDVRCGDTEFPSPHPPFG